MRNYTYIHVIEVEKSGSLLIIVRRVVKDVKDVRENHEARVKRPSASHNTTILYDRTSNGHVSCHIDQLARIGEKKMHT